MASVFPTPLIHTDRVEPYQEYTDRFVAEDFPLSFDDSGQSYCHDEFRYVMGFLYQYRGSKATLRNYAKELERFCAWAWQYNSKSIFKMKRQDALMFLEFLVEPPSHWIADKPYKKLLPDGQINKKWRPFVAADGKYAVSDAAKEAAFTILKSFYGMAVEDLKTEINPFGSIRQKSIIKTKKRSTARVTHKLTDLQWQYLVETATKMAEESPKKHERSLFIVSCMLGMYLRISDLVPYIDQITGSEDIPLMKHFFRREEGWWFRARGKGNVEGQIAVSNDVLDALKRWRKYLGLSSLPTLADTEVLIPSMRGNRPVRSTQQISNVVKEVFKAACAKMIDDGLSDEAGELSVASAHWLRHTGISHDVKIRPREHVRDDARHASMQTTDKYIDDDLRERSETAKHKKIAEF